MHKTDAGKADYRNERKKFGSHNGESREATGSESTHFPYERSGTGKETWPRRIMTSLPRCRTRSKPCSLKKLHNSAPEKTRSLGMRHFKLFDGNFAFVQPATNLRLVRALQPEFDCFFDHFFRVLRRFALTDDADGLVSRRIDLFRCAVSALAEVEFLFEIFAQFYGCVKAASYFAAESFGMENRGQCANLDTLLHFRGCLAWLLGSGRFFRKLESDLTVFEFQMSGKRPPLF